MSTITLTEEEAALVESGVKEGGFENAHDYLLELAREAQKRKREERKRKAAEFEAAMIEGIESGPAVPMDAQFWAQLFREVDENLEKQGKPTGLYAMFEEQLTQERGK